jgi:uncharacterized protein
VLGSARSVDDPEQRLAALRAFTERLVPGRWSEVRPPSEKELRATRVLALRLDESSAKIRTGPPVDEDEDYALRAWAGVIPLATVARPPIPDPRLAAGITPSETVSAWLARRS